MSAPSADRVDFASVVERLAAERVHAHERRRFRRAPLVVGGRMLDAFGREHDCRTADLSPGDARIAAPATLQPGQNVVLYLDGFGRIAGHVARRCAADECAIIFDVSPHKREKMAETLTWLINRARLEPEDAPRLSLRDGQHFARLETEDGGVIEGEVLDFSLAGLTVRAAKLPPHGAWVRVGGVYGRVARAIEGGFAVDFAPRPPPAERG